MHWRINARTHKVNDMNASPNIHEERARAQKTQALIATIDRDLQIRGIPKRSVYAFRYVNQLTARQRVDIVIASGVRAPSTETLRRVLNDYAYWAAKSEMGRAAA